MAYAHKVVRVTLAGTMFNGVENWSTGFFLGKKDADAAAPTQAAADAVRTAWTTFMSASSSGISSAYKFTSCKLASMGADGKTIDDEVVYSYPTGTVSGGNNGAILPPQCAVVVTLTSARPRGRASKGRMYLPGIVGPVSSDGKVGATLMGTMPPALQTFFNALDGSIDIADSLILASRGEGLGGGLLAQNDWVTGIRVGDVIDTQRRRRNGLTEVYTTLPVNSTTP